MPSHPKFSSLFSDIDGTCVHYDDEEQFTATSLINEGLNQGLWQAEFADGTRAEVLRLPPSSSGSQGIISAASIHGYANIRKKGVKVILISGCRSSTLFERLPFLPAADAFVCESGGRIFYPSSSLPTALGLREDLNWRQSQEAAGPIGQESVPPADRSGVLWDQFRKIKEAGIEVDARNYTTAFRVKLKHQDEMEAAGVGSLLPGLSAAVNLGAVDIYPSTSGKKQAALYLMNKFGASHDGRDSVFMCDDDNDIELALTVSRAYLPSITSESMHKTVAANPGHFTVATKKSVFATEEIISTLLSDLDS